MVKSKVKVDFRQLKRFADRFEKMANEELVEQFIREALLEIGKKLIAKTKRKTPVNTGLLRNSWQIGNIERQGDEYVVEVYTDLEYASFVENGFRAHWVPGEWKGKQFVYDPDAKTGMQVGKKGAWVPGKFMMTISKNEIEREMPRYIQRKQLELLKRIINGH